MNLSLKDSRINNAVALFTSGELNVRVITSYAGDTSLIFNLDILGFICNNDIIVMINNTIFEV